RPGGRSISTTCISSIQARIESAGAGIRWTPPSPTNMTPARSGLEFIEECFKQVLLLEQPEILPQLLVVERSVVSAQQGPDIVEITNAGWIVHIPLQLERHQAFGT